MKLIVLTRCTHNWKLGHSHLVNSLHHFGYDFKVVIDDSWQSWKNMPRRHSDWLKENRGSYTHVLHTDAWDTLALGSIDEFCEKYKAVADGKWLHSAEKNCFPKKEESKYVTYSPEDFTSTSPWKFTNGGGYVAPIDLFIDIVDNTPRRETNMEETNENDNEWGNNLYLFYNKNRILLDDRCEIFQSLFWESPQDFSWKDGRLFNNVTKTNPIFIHGNGGSDIQKIWKNLGF